MNGKMAKMLRKLNRDSKSSKRIFHGFDQATKSKLRKSVDDVVQLRRNAVDVVPLGVEE